MSATTIIVNDESPRRQYTATGGQTVFDFPIPFFEQGDLTVYLTPVGQTPDDATDILVITTNYTVSGENTQDGGLVTLVVGATAGDIVTIERVLDIERTADYQNSGDLLAETLNREQDSEIMISQQLREDIGRGLRFQASGATQSATVPEPVAGRSLKWNPAGDALINSDDDLDAIAAAAQASADASAASAAASDSSATASANSAIASDLSKDYATEWANKAEDSLISVAAGGDQVDDYSALHHANKAAASAATNNLPAISASDEGSGIAVNAAGTGYNLVNIHRKNELINGDFSVNQRAFAGGQPAAGVYGYDRWKGDTLGTRIEQVVENTRTINETYVISWVGGTGTADVDGVTGLSSGDSFTLNTSANFSVIVPTDAADIQLERGATDTEFEYRHPAEELMLCQRYYFRLDSSQDSTAFIATGSIQGSTTIHYTMSVPFNARPVTPVMTISNAADFQSVDSGTVRNLTNLILDSSRQGGVGLTATGAGMTTGNASILQFDGSGSRYIAFDWEL